MRIYLVQIAVDETEYDGADEVIGDIDNRLPSGMEVISVEELADPPEEKGGDA